MLHGGKVPRHLEIFSKIFEKKICLKYRLFSFLDHLEQKKFLTLCYMAEKFSQHLETFSKIFDFFLPQISIFVTFRPFGAKIC